MNEKIEKIILPRINDPRGNLTYFESMNHIPFSIERVHWIYDVPAGEIRGSHAFKENREFIIALSGSFDISLDTGTEILAYHLNRSYYGIYVPKMIWRTMDNFSTNSLCLIASSTKFSEADYIYDYKEFLKAINNGV